RCDPDTISMGLIFARRRKPWLPRCVHSQTLRSTAEQTIASFDCACRAMRGGRSAQDDTSGPWTARAKRAPLRMAQAVLRLRAQSALRSDTVYDVKGPRRRRTAFP